MQQLYQIRIAFLAVLVSLQVANVRAAFLLPSSATEGPIIRANPTRIQITEHITLRVPPILAKRDAFDDDEEEDDEPPNVNIADFSPPSISFGLNKGRSSPSQRKAMGRKSGSLAHIFICSNCGSEFIQFLGRCPTCREWNTLQEHAVRREDQWDGTGSGIQNMSRNSRPQPIFSSSAGAHRPLSWLEGAGDGIGNTPVRISDLVDSNKKDSVSSPSTAAFRQRQRLRIPNDDELNTVLGGGIMQGSITLLGGDPGVGKSTLLLQTAASLASLSTPSPGIGMGKPQLPADGEPPLGPVWYTSGEENPQQIASRAERLGIAQQELFLLSETHVDSLCAQVVSQIQRHEQQQMKLQPGNIAESTPKEHEFDTTGESNSHGSASLVLLPPSMLVIDSIQTMICDAGGSSAAGGITQVRECVALLLRLAKSTGIPILLVGHVTKSGDVAGPRTVEHMVDAVLYLENAASGGPTNNLRMLRASKNRFGSTDEVGVYEMTAGHLLPVSDPSSLFLALRSTETDVEGSAIALVLEGMRALAVEIQALVTPAHFQAAYGKRTVDGIAFSRLQLLMGVLQKCGGIYMGKQDVYVNVIGRIRLDRAEANAADLAIVVALVSSLTSIPVRADTAFAGEVGLLGELRAVPALEKRLQEAKRVGFSRVVSARQYPSKSRKRFGGHKSPEGSAAASSPVRGVDWIQCQTVVEAINAGLIHPLPKRRTRKSTVKRGDPPPAQLEDLGLEIMDDEPSDEEAFDV